LNKYPKDESIEKIGFPAWREAMLSLLVYLYETEILTGKFKEPDCVMEESNIYKSNNDSFAKFMQERLIKDVGAQTKEKDILKEYKTWLSQEPDMKALTPIDVRRKMIEKYGKPITDKKDGKDYYRGVRIAIDGEDVSGNFIDLPSTTDEPSVDIIPPAEADADEVAVEVIPVKKQPKKKKSL